MPDVFDELNDSPIPRMHSAPVTCEEAIRIWRECGLGDASPEWRITRNLELWAFTEGFMYGHGTDKYARWVSPTGTRYDMKLKTLTRWMICACNPNTD